MGNAAPATCGQCGVEDLDRNDAAGEDGSVVRLDWDQSPRYSIEGSENSLSSSSLPDITRISEMSISLQGRMPVLPKGGNLTIMMFGMTGAGKSSLGNLIAGEPVFLASDDTASVTNLDSVLRYEPDDRSMVLLDTIGLGDTEIDQDDVVASIRDVALSAPCGIDVLFFVLRFGRITDDTIARLIYLTDCLWGRDCLPNLYVVVTGASRFLGAEEEAAEWVHQQADNNWRFQHIFDLVGNDPAKFIFVDNPDPLSREPNIEERQNLSRSAVLRCLVKHDRAVVPPFAPAVVKKARELSLPEIQELERRREEEKELFRDEHSFHSISTSDTQQKKDNSPDSATDRSGRPTSGKISPDGEGSNKHNNDGNNSNSNNRNNSDSNDEGSSNNRSTSKASSTNDLASQRTKLGNTIVELCELRAQAIEKRGRAERALRERLAELKADPTFAQEVALEAERATAKFAELCAEAAAVDGGMLSHDSQESSGKTASPKHKKTPKAGKEGDKVKTIEALARSSKGRSGSSLVAACKNLVGSLTRKVSKTRKGPSTTAAARDPPAPASQKTAKKGSTAYSSIGSSNGSIASCSNNNGNHSKLTVGGGGATAIAPSRSPSASKSSTASSARGPTAAAPSGPAMGNMGNMKRVRSR